MAELRLNNQSDKTSGAITFSNGSTTTGTFASAPGFATLSSPDYYKIVVEPDTANEEIVYLTAYTAAATTGTFTRAQEGTTGAAHSAKPWVHGPTAADFTGPLTDLIVPGQKTGLKSISDEFTATSLSGSWTRVDYGNSSAVTWTPGNGMLSALDTGGDAASGWHALLAPLGALTAPVTIEAAIRLNVFANANAGAGLLFADGATVGSGKQVDVDVLLGGNYGGGVVSKNFRQWSGFNSYVADVVASTTQDIHIGPWLFLRLVWVSSNTWRAEHSIDGVSWTKFNGTFTQADGSVTMTPTYCGLWMSTYGGSSTLQAVFDHFRVY